MRRDTESGKLYQDEMYGAKVLSPLAVALIDTPEFQRLAGLKQLGFSDLVYRGAQHTRLAHSVGTYFLTRTIMRRIVQNHERLRLGDDDAGPGHPGSELADSFQLLPPNSYPKSVVDPPVSHQSKWRGATEVVSIAGLLHDLGHVPFGHTLEDEFGVFDRHDRLAGPRLHQMLFNESSEIAVVFARDEPWIGNIPNEELRRLIYLILSWKDRIDPPAGFDAVLDQAIDRPGTSADQKNRLRQLKDWYREFTEAKQFMPFMSDVIGNTICADLLDYLPRDRQNLGMEYRDHARLQRYMTVRRGTLYEGEGLRVSIMVTRRGRGGQRRDVATAVLDVMRERYEMAERVYYHHKKAAASSMLAKLAEICPDRSRPKDDEIGIYPAIWDPDDGESLAPSNMVHFSDVSLIDHLGLGVSVEKSGRKLQRKLYVGLRYRRKSLYRTLLVVDTDLVRTSTHSVSYFASSLRGSPGGASGDGRHNLEKRLSDAAGVEEGEVLIYCPSPDMQAKEVDVRLEIRERRVLPLRLQRESFAYHADIRVLEDYYRELWRIYVFVSPEVFAKQKQCQAIVDEFCEFYGIPKFEAYQKIREYGFESEGGVEVEDVLKPFDLFITGLPFDDTPSSVTQALLRKAGGDAVYSTRIQSGLSPETRLSQLFDIVALEAVLNPSKGKKPKRDEARTIEGFIESLDSDAQASLLSSRNSPENKSKPVPSSFVEYERELMNEIFPELPGTDTGSNATK